MNTVDDFNFKQAERFGRPANATISGHRYNGFLLGNKFVFTDVKHAFLECGPGEYNKIKVWRR